MSRQDVRLAILGALRQSPWVEHKIRLSELFAGDEGHALLYTIAVHEGIPVETLNARVALLPPLDLYIPSTASRRSWRGGPHIAVVPAVKENRIALTTYDITGARRDVRLGEKVTFATPTMIFLTTPEPRSERFGANAAVASARTARVDAPVDDGTSAAWGGGAVLHLASGKTLVLSLRDLMARRGEVQPMAETCESCIVEDGGGGGGGGGPPPVRTYITGIKITHVCDWNDCGQNNEFEWHNYIWNGSAWVGRLDVALSLPADYASPETGFALLANYYVPGFLQSDIIESDGDIGNDDKFTNGGQSPQWRSNENGVWKGAGTLECPFGQRDPYTNNCMWPLQQQVVTRMGWF